jgi:hypothetical protein
MSDITVEIIQGVDINGVLPTPSEDNSVLVSDSGGWLAKTLDQFKTILGLKSAAFTESSDYAIASHTHTASQVTDEDFQTVTFANPLEIDGTTYKDFICTVTGDTTINLNNLSSGNSGMIKLIISGAGGYTVPLGTMFTERLGDTTEVDTTTGKINYISYRKVGTEIAYTINIVQ